MSAIAKVLITIARKVYPRPTILFTDLPERDEPVIFVANHEMNYGPSIMQLFFPLPYRPWVIHRMLEPGDCRAYIQHDFFEARLGVPEAFSARIAKLIEQPLISLMRSTRPIPVYRDGSQRIVQTFNESINALENGENLLVFPENGSLPPYSPRIKDFHTGFLYLGKLYHRRTGKRLVFYPVSLNPHAHSIQVGKRISYNPAADNAPEQERIRQHLLQQIDTLYETARETRCESLNSSRYESAG